jgi:putative transposase
MATALALTTTDAPGDICQALGLSRATFHRGRLRMAAPPQAGTAPGDRAPSSSTGCNPKREARRSHRALAETEREAVRGQLHSERFRDSPPLQVYATLLDEGQYLCSPSTMYRILGERGEVRERRNQLVHPAYAKPELLATRPNELWSWDITKLLGAAKWTYYYLYVILDVFSRYVVGWALMLKESAQIAEELIAQTCQKQRVQPGQLTLHADRGSSMTSKPVAFLMADLGVTKTHSRPHVSNDNPYSESQFKTMKYRPEFPARFTSAQEARQFCQAFFNWYNTQHRHSGIALLTPETVHYGKANQVIEQRTAVPTAAHAEHPERFVRKQPIPPALPNAVWINPPPSGGDDNRNHQK